MREENGHVEQPGYLQNGQVEKPGHSQNRLVKELQLHQNGQVETPNSIQNGHVNEPRYRSEKEKSLLQSAEKLLMFGDIPHWQQDNEYIISGYRPTTNSVLKCLTSIFDVHNETVSIHTHLWPSLLFYWLPFRFYWQIYKVLPYAQIEDFVVFSIFSISVATCFMLSMICHLVWNHSPSFASWGNKLDYLGIILSIWGSSIPSIYYGLYCNRRLRVMYWSSLTILAITCAVFTMSPRFCTPKFREYRAAMYAGLALTTIAFATHGFLLHGWHMQKQRMALDWMIVMAVLNLIGATVYSVRIPEKYWPHRFDIVGGSHQIFHIMVVLGALAHLVGLWKAFEFTRSPAGSCLNI